MSEIKPVYLLSYDHGGYILWGPHFKERIESGISWLEKYSKFKIGLDNEAFCYDKYAEVNPKIIETIQNMLKKYEGRFGIGSSTYGQPLSTFINEESNVRQLVYAVRTNLKYFGVTPPVFAISEHALHSQIPQLIKQAGYKGAIMRTHFQMYGYNPTYNEAFGWWVGADGTKIPAVPTYDGEGTEFGATTYDNWILTRWPDKTDRSLEDFKKKFCHIQPLLGSRYDDIVLRCEKLVEHVEKSSEYEWIILEELLDKYEEPKAEFYAAADDFTVRMPWGYCGNKIFNDCRKAELSCGIAERANAAALLAGGQSRQQELEKSWKNLLAAQHHDVQICGLLSEAKEHISKSLESSQEVISESMQFISTLFKTDKEHNLVVFNPLSWKSKQEVSTEVTIKVNMECEEFSYNGLEVLYCGKRIPCKIKVLDKSLDLIKRAVISFVAEVEPLTAKLYSIIPCEISDTDFEAVLNHSTGFNYNEQSGILTTPYYEICLNDNGICFIKNKNTGVEYIHSEKGSLFCGTIDDMDCKSSGKWIVNCKGQQATAVQMGQIGGIAYEFEMVVGNTTQRIDCNVTFTHHGEKIGEINKNEPFEGAINGFVHESKLRFLLNPCTSKDAVGIRDLPFIISSAKSKYVQGNYWTAISDNNIGFAYFNKGAMGAVREEEGFSLVLAYANRYVWGTRYLHGKYTHEFSLYPFEGQWEKADLHRKALEYQYPFSTCDLKGPNKGNFKDSISFIDVSPSENVVLSALYPEDGNIIARFYEFQGKDGLVMAKSDFAHTLDEVTIMGEHSGDVIDSKIQFEKHEIKSIRFCNQKRDLPE